MTTCVGSTIRPHSIAIVSFAVRLNSRVFRCLYHPDFEQKPRPQSSQTFFVVGGGTTSTLVILGSDSSGLLMNGRGTTGLKGKKSLRKALKIQKSGKNVESA